MKMYLIIIISLILGLVSTASARTVIIPGDYPTIQEGIDSCNDGDTVLVSVGIYYENIIITDLNIVLASFYIQGNDAWFIDNTVIDGNYSGSVVSIAGQDASALITGFTIQNGFSNYGGGGIYLSGANTMINNNFIIQNVAYGESIGGGIYCRYSNAVIRENIITQNIASWGGGIGLDNSDAVISNNYIMENSVDPWRGGGIHCDSGSDAIIINNVIIENTAVVAGGGIDCINSNPAIINNICGNNRAARGGAISLDYSDPFIKNTILWGDSSNYNDEIFVDDVYGPSYPNINYCNIADTLWPGEGNMSVDPLFRDSENGDYRLKSTACGFQFDSPCIDAGDPDFLDYPLACFWGLGSERSDMGAFGGLFMQTDIKNPDLEIELPSGICISQNYPNPFNSSTVINYSLPSTSFVTVSIYNIMGQLETTLFEGIQQAGSHTVVWEAGDISSGVYFYRIKEGEFSQTRKSVLLR